MNSGSFPEFFYRKERQMISYTVSYKYNKPGSRSGSTTSLCVRAGSEEMALILAIGQAENKHPGYDITILKLTPRN